MATAVEYGFIGALVALTAVAYVSLQRTPDTSTPTRSAFEICRHHFEISAISTEVGVLCREAIRNAGCERQRDEQVIQGRQMEPLCEVARRANLI